MIKTLLVLALSASPALAYPMACNVTMSNADILATIEKHGGETLHFVGIQRGTNFPIEVTISEDGTWTMLVVQPEMVCFVAMGTNWLAVEPKSPGVEN